MSPSLDNSCLVQLPHATNGIHEVKSKELKNGYYIEIKELNGNHDIEDEAPNGTHDREGVELPVVNGTDDVKTKELYSDLKNFDVDFKRFYGIEPTRVDRRFVATLSKLTYLPKFDNPRADWVVTAALNSFRAYQCGELGVVKRFATCGTGSGTDVIAALDTFPQLSGVAMTDLHNAVVKAAKSNVLSATEKADERVRTVAREAVAVAGDVLLPLKGQESFDVIYENLPNIPLSVSTTGDLCSGQTSSTYVGDRTADNIPGFVSAALLDLHYVCLTEARVFGLLGSSGTILSSMGGRVPLEAMFKMADAAGYVGRVLSLSWKKQSEPEAVIGGYAEHEKKGLGPFFFYPTSALERVFSTQTPAAAGLRASQIENQLLPERLDAVTALQKHRQGVDVGHTVVVLASVLKGI
ncbi:hypothetical protein MMC30_004320 [Trapelia coarctata]|nr:hypothetical protein [Trapelia coarctata]